ncbi:hypothetical protein J6590_060823 [Homalodisca vitripennis]|nr:hypothetical protein J6590_060823 [Homalodisca vitripennis]
MVREDVFDIILSTSVEDFALSARDTSTQVIRRAAQNHPPDINWPRVAALRPRILRRCMEDVTEFRVIVDRKCARQVRAKPSRLVVIEIEQDLIRKWTEYLDQLELVAQKELSDVQISTILLWTLGRTCLQYSKVTASYTWTNDYT